MPRKSKVEPILFTPDELFKLAEVFSVAQAAEFMGLGEETVRERIKDKSLHHVRVRGRLMVPRIAAQAFIAARIMAPMQGEPKHLFDENLWQWRYQELLRNQLAQMPSIPAPIPIARNPRKRKSKTEPLAQAA